MDIYDEKLMRAFRDAGGGTREFHRKRKEAAKRLASNVQDMRFFGYLYVDGTIVTEGPVWALASIKLGWMPVPLSRTDYLLFIGCNERIEYEGQFDQLDGSVVLNLAISYSVAVR